ncbi:MAG: DUF2058 family protein [Lysobacterales bacterium]
MADSLQDQLRALGLANKPQRERGGHKDASKGGKAARQRPGQKPGPRSDGELSLDQAYALREQEEQRLAQQARDRKRAEERRRREINDSIRTIIEAHRLNRDDAEIARNFMFRGRIRKLYVTPEQQQALSEGQLGIVYLSGSYHVLASEHLDAVRGFSAEHVVEQQSGAEDEEDFPVPDDLTW